MKNKNTFTLRLSEQQLKTLREIAEQEKRTVSAVIRNLIDGFQENQVCENHNPNGVLKSVSKPKCTRA